MPTKTFLNLDDKKKTLVNEALFEEFSKNSFSESKVANIVRIASIPRGSFYNYFKDILDAYLYTCDLLIEEVRDNQLIIDKNRVIKNNKLNANGIFEIIEETIEHFENNKRLDFKINFLKEKNQEILKKKEEVNIFRKNKIKEVLEKFKLTGVIKKDTNIDAFYFLVSAIEEKMDRTQALNNRDEVLKKIKGIVPILIEGIGE